MLSGAWSSRCPPTRHPRVVARRNTEGEMTRQMRQQRGEHSVSRGAMPLMAKVRQMPNPGGANLGAQSSSSAPAPL